jgi:thiamine biosynthesis lipoprotein
MGTRFEIKVVSDSRRAGARAIEAAFDELNRVEALLSEWRESSEISAVNRRAGSQPVEAGRELLGVLQRAHEISAITDGAFDITVAVCSKTWSFAEGIEPSPDEVRRCLELVGYGEVLVDPLASTVRFARDGMRLGIAGIGKGYGIDAAAAVLEDHGIASFVVDGGGDVRVAGRAPDRPWRVGIAHPRRPGELYGEIPLSDASVATSGDYQQYFERGGTRLHHILDPRTGRPASGVSSVTVIAADAATADALATGIFVMGSARGLALAEQLEDVEALVFDESGEPSFTSGFPAGERAGDSDLTAHSPSSGTSSPSSPSGSAGSNEAGETISQ